MFHLNQTGLSASHCRSLPGFIAIGLALFICACGSDNAAEVPDNGNPGAITPTASSDFAPPVENGSGGGALTFTGAEIEDGNLVVHLKAAYEGIEPFGEEFLLIDGERVEARMDLHPNNDIDLIFDGVDHVAGTVVMDMVNLTEEVDIQARIGDGSFTFPDGVEATFSDSDISSTSNGVELRYHTATPTSTAISIATISSGGTTYNLRGSGSAYSASGEVRNPRITFPTDAEEALEDPDAIVAISEVRRVVRYEIPMPLPSNIG
jgi:hypothetical protein